MIKKLCHLLAGGLLLAGSLMVVTDSMATPREIVIVRHGDKLDQNSHGPSLTAMGYLRAVKFAYYFLNTFGEPDALFATNPEDMTSVTTTHSIRELQTLSPLVEMLSLKYPDKDYRIYAPYYPKDTDKMANILFTDPTFDNKLVVVAWKRSDIVQLVQALGVKDSQPAWPDTDFDSVYVLHYQNSQLTGYELLHQQYAIKNTVTWDTFNSLG